MSAANAPVPQGTSALWNLGFRPFYLFAAAYSGLAMAVWAARFAGWVDGIGWLRDPLWHAHEMLFGYTSAVIAGFLLTAVRNWTARPTPTGAALAGIVALWIAGRAAAAVPSPVAVAVLDTAFLAAVALGIGRPLVATGNRNAFFVLLLLALAAANVSFCLAMAGAIAFPARASLHAGLDLVAFIMAVMGGRVIPMFTANAIPAAHPQRWPWLERTCLGSLLVLIVVGLVGAPAALVAALAAVAAAVHALRLALWQPWRTASRPILWILHLSYAWIVVYLALRVPAALDLVSASIAVHALTVGGIGGMTLGMMTRTARGHTGRPLVAGVAETTAYGLVQVAALVRVVAPFAAPALFAGAIAVSGFLWAAAFGIFMIVFWPILTRARADGREG